MMLKKCPTILLFSIPLIILICGCPYESQFPLSSPSMAQLDEELIGVWKNDILSITLTFSPFNEREFLIVFNEIGSDKPRMLRATVTMVGQDKFLNVQDLNVISSKKRKWMFIHYSVSDSILKARFVDENLFEQKIVTPEELREFLQKNIQNEKLFEANDEIVLERINLRDGS